MSMYIKPHTHHHRRPVYRWDSVESEIHVPLDVTVDDRFLCDRYDRSWSRT